MNISDVIKHPYTDDPYVSELQDLAFAAQERADRLQSELDRARGLIVKKNVADKRLKELIDEAFNTGYYAAVLEQVELAEDVRVDYERRLEGAVATRERLRQQILEQVGGREESE